MFRNRREAGRAVGERLAEMSFDNVVVLGLPRGGVPVAFEIAQALHAPLDVLLVRKVGVPSQPELAMGAIAEDDVRVVNDRVLRAVGVPDEEFVRVEAAERQELERRALRYRGNRPRVDLAGHTAILVDDGVATGATARAACLVARLHGATRVVFATPVAPPSAVAELSRDADEVIALETPEAFYAIGQFYDDFGQTGDDEVVLLLRTRA
jgi:putative phosphoribosyl transferase